MKRYELKYIESGEVKHTELLAENAKAARKAFRENKPELKPEDMMSIRLLSPAGTASDSESRYSAAITISRVIKVVGWGLLAVGGVLLLVALAEKRFLLMLSLSVCATGLFNVALAEIMRAIVDTADNSRKSLNCLREISNKMHVTDD